MRKLLFRAWAVLSIGIFLAYLAFVAWAAFHDPVPFLLAIGIGACLAGWLYFGIWLSGRPTASSPGPEEI
jgi:hypothetical protein